MPLNKSCSLSAYKANVSELIKSGRPPKQAVAIAIRTLKKSCGVESEKRMSPSQIVGEGVEYIKMKELSDSLKSFGKIGFDNGYDTFDDVLDKFDEMRITLKPTDNDMYVVADFKRQCESAGRNADHKGYWESISKQCQTVVECIRLYGLALENEVPGLEDSFQKRAIELANLEKWK